MSTISTSGSYKFPDVGVGAAAVPLFHFLAALGDEVAGCGDLEKLLFAGDFLAVHPPAGPADAD